MFSQEPITMGEGNAFAEAMGVVPATPQQTVAGKGLLQGNPVGGQGSIQTPSQVPKSIQFGQGEVATQGNYTDEASKELAMQLQSIQINTEAEATALMLENVNKSSQEVTAPPVQGSKALPSVDFEVLYGFIKLVVTGQVYKQNGFVNISSSVYNISDTELKDLLNDKIKYKKPLNENGAKYLNVELTKLINAQNSFREAVFQSIKVLNS